MAFQKWSGMVILCAHCGTQTNSKYCPLCRTAAHRKEMDEANDKHFMKELGIHYVCPACTKNKEKKELQQKYDA